MIGHQAVSSKFTKSIILSAILISFIFLVTIWADTTLSGSLSNFLLNGYGESDAGAASQLKSETGDDDAFISELGAPSLVSSANGKIAFSSDRDGDAEIYTMNADGTNVVPLTTAVNADFAPAWSPDGTQIVFVSSRDGNSEIYTMNADGSNQIRLTNNAAEDIEPAWSPDGTKIAFTSKRDGDYEIFTLTLATSTLAQLTTNTFSDNKAAWSPDGTRIAFVSNQSNTAPNIWLMDATGNIQGQVTCNSSSSTLEPSWSPDGQFIAFSSNYQGNFEIYKVNVTNLNYCYYLQFIRLTNNSTVDRQPTWSSDGSKILFQTNRDDNNEIYSINSSDGSIPQRLTADGADDAYPAMQAVPALRINDVTVSEPASGTATMTFTVALSMKYPQPISVMYATADATAISGSDYQSAANTLVFNANETSKTFTVTNNSDAVQENFEHFFVNLSNATNAAITDAQGRGTIRPPVYNGKIAFHTNRDVNYELYTMNPDGTGQTNITNHPSYDEKPTWSPDGTKIAFESPRANPGYQQIFTTDPQGLLVTQLTFQNEYHYTPSWSPDGAKIAFRKYINNGYQIFVMDADGSNVTQLTTNLSSSNDRVTWSPDGTKIAFLTSGSTLYSINADGTGLTLISNTLNTSSGYGINWSPDGTKFVFVNYQTSYWQICTMNADGTNRIPLTNDASPVGVNKRDPFWSPDGSQIVYAASQSGSSEDIWVIKADGSSRMRLTDTPTFFEYSPVWQPSLTPFPDLRTSAATAPTITTDTAFNLNWTALNEGAATGANWTEKIYFSTDNQIGNDLFLGEQQITSALAPNQTANLQQSVTVPWSAVPADGNYFLIVQTDANANLQETEEVDNWRVVPVTVQRSLRPDLTVDSITVSPKANAGDTVRVDFRVKNRGNGVTGVSGWTDWLYLSSDSVPNSSDPVKIAVPHTGALNPNATYDAFADVPIPANIAPGLYNFIVYTDFDGSDNRDGVFQVNEGIESNNYNIAQPIIINVPGTSAFVGNNVGNIPDGILNGGFGAPRDITFNVVGINGSNPNIVVTFAATHNWLSDVEATLIAPDGTTQHKLFAQTGITTANLCYTTARTLNGQYTFTDQAGGNNWWTIANTFGTIPNAAYKTVPAGGAGVTSPPTPTVMNLIFAGLTPAQINGTWTLRFRDSCDHSNSTTDVGSITFASLAFGTDCGSNKDGLVSWWKGDGNAFDSAGSRQGLVIGDTTFAAGKIGQAFDFDGSGDYIEIPDDNSLEVQTGDFTIDTWFYPRGTSTNYLFGKGSFGVNGYLGYSSSSSAYFDIRNNAGNSFAVSASSLNIAPNEWHHYAAVKEGTNIKLYIDGTLIGTTAISGTFANSLSPFVIGNYGATPSGGTNGLIDEMHVYNRALSHAELRTIYAANSSGLCFSNSMLSFSPNPVMAGKTTTGTFTLPAPAPIGGTTIALSSSSSSVASVPASILIAEGQTSGTFSVTTFTRTTEAYINVTATYNGNSRTTMLTVAKSSPDIQVISATVPVQAATSTPFNISWTDLNDGVVAANNWYDRVIFSTDNILGNSNDRDLGLVYNNQAVNPNQTKNFTTNITIQPSWIPASGDYYLFFQADSYPYSPVDEGRFETNNLFVKPISVVVNVPDLQVLSITAPATIDTDTQFTISWVDKNFGGASTTGTGWYDAVYFSPDNLVNSNDVQISTLSYTGNLASNQTLDRSLTTLVIPPRYITQEGDYYIYVKTDTGNQIDEGGTTNESNNITFQQIHVRHIAPDLQVSNINSPAIVNTTEPFNVTWTDKNFGNGRARPTWYDDVYLSFDNQVGNDIALVYYSTISTPLDPNQSVDTTRSVIIPTSQITADGDYYLYVRTDNYYGYYQPWFNVDEGNNENNNITFKPIHVNRRYADLQIPAMNAAAEVETEQFFDFSWTIHNGGTLRTQANWTDRIYFSQDSQVGSDLLIGDFAFTGTPVEANQSIQRTQSIKIPLSAITQTGNYFFYVETDIYNQIDETSTGDNNNRSGLRPIRVRRTVRPDLIVQSITAPTNTFFDQDIQVQWTARNSGNGATNAAEWTDTIYLSNNTTVSGEDIILGSRQNVSALGANESYTSVADVHIPRGQVGSQYILVKTDNGGQVGEDNETNNVQFRQINLQTPTLPDLQVAFVQAPLETFAGTTMLVNWRVENRGTTNTPPAQGNWVDRVYLSQDTILNTATDRFVAERNYAGGLTQNAGYTVNGFTVQVPANIMGNWYVFVVTDANDGVYEYNRENNNSTYDILQPGSPLVVHATPPDLAILTPMVAPANAVTGQQIPISYKVKNQGAFEAVPIWYDKIYLSIDQSLSPTTDVLLTTITRPNPLKPDDEYTINTSVILPTCISGTYYLFATADSGDQIFEFHPNYNAEANNTSQPKLIQIANTPPDLRVVSITNPATGVSGQSVQISWTVTNQGIGDTTQSWYDRIVISPFANTPSNQVLLGSFLHDGVLAPNASYTNTQNIPIPSYLQGDWYVYISTDAGSGVAECTNENNNTTISPTRIALGNPSYQPDLRIVAATNPAAINPGETFTVQWTGANNGATALPDSSWNDYVFLSTDQILSGNDTTISGKNINAALAINQTYQAQATTVMPNVAAGNYYLIVAADYNNHIAEGYFETNNTNAFPVTVAASQVDLQVTNINAPVNAIAGQTMPVSFTVTNTGTGTTYVSNWTDYVVISLDSFVDPSDRTLGYFNHTGALSGGANYTVTGDVFVPNGFTGEYNVFVVTDLDNRIYYTERVFESNELNNTSLPDTTILSLAAPADLIIQTVSAPANASPGEAATFSWTVKNQGPNTAPGLWVDSVYLSQNQTWDIGDVLVGQQTHSGAIAPNGTYSGLLTATVPAMNLGTYYAIVRTDARNAVRENNEINNATVASASTVVDVTTLQLGVPLTTMLFTKQERFYKVTAPANETLLVTLDGADGSNNELYTRFGQMVSRSQYDFFYSQKYAPDQETVVPNTQAGVYYNLARADYVPSGLLENMQTQRETEPAKNPANTDSADVKSDEQSDESLIENVTIKAETIPFGIRRVSPAVTGKDRFTTVTVEGARFADTALVRLVAADNTTYQSELSSVGTARIAALFDFKNIPIGNYAVEVVNPGNQIARRDNAVQVVSGGGAIVSAQVFGPDTVKVGLSARYNVFLTNSGRNDSVLSMMLIQIPRGATFDIGQPQFDYINSRSVLPEGFNSWRDVPISFERGDFIYIPLSVPLIQAGGFKSFSLNVKPPPGAASVTVRTILMPSRMDLDSNVSLMTGAQACPIRSDCAKQLGEQITDAVFDKVKEELFDLLPTACAQQIADYFIEHNDFIMKEALGTTDEEMGILPIVWEMMPPTKLVQECGTALLKKFPIFKIALEITDAIKKSLDFAEDAGNIYNDCLRQIENSTATGGACESSGTGGGSGSKTTIVVRPTDPNDKVGPAGYGAQKFVPPGQNLDYRINFENVSNASAYAQQIRITDQLPATLDARTLRLREIGFGSYRFTVPNNRAYYQTRAQFGADLGNLLADISAGLDIATGNVTWTMRAIDPATGEQPVNPNAGLLPPNDATHRGEGYVIFTVRAMPGNPTGTLIENNASIVFDTEQPIVTNTVTNTLDADVPTSQVAALPAISQNVTFTVNWSGSDAADGSELGSFDVWVSENDSPYTLFKSATTETSGHFTGQATKTYRFYSVARDNAGNVEAAPVTPDATTTIANQCPVTLNPANATVASVSGAASFAVTAAPTCAWNATGNDSWIIVNNSSGVGNGIVNYTVSGNTGAQRSGTITINGQNFSVTQTAGNLSISGSITYANSAVVANIPGVSLNAAGLPQSSAMTDANGNYSLNNLGVGAYTVTPSKIGSINGINSSDASLIQQHLVGLTTLTANQLLAADANNSGAVNSLDAARIQQYSVGIPSTHVIGQWKFIPSNKQYNSVANNLTGENYLAVLMGEVSGNWTPPGSLIKNPSAEEQSNPLEAKQNNRSAPIDERLKRSKDSKSLAIQKQKKNSKTGAALSVLIPSNATSSTGNVITIPVIVGDLNNSNVESFDFSVFYNPAILQPALPLSVIAGTSSQYCSVLTNSPTAGRLAVSAACPNPSLNGGQGTLLNLRFTVLGTVNQQTTLSFVNPATNLNSFQFNDGEPQAITTDGNFIVLGPTAANVSISGRVLTANGRGIGNAQVVSTDSYGNSRTTLTSPFGYYRFADLTAGETFIISVRAKRYRFNPPSLVVNATEIIVDANFLAEP